MPSDAGSRAGHRRLNLLVGCLVFGFTVIVAQLIHYQVIRHSELKTKAEEQHTWDKQLPPTRGDIVDTHHHILACNVVQWDISVSPPLIGDPDGLADELSMLLGMPWDKVYAALTADAGWVQLARFVPQKVGEEIVALENPGITCEPRPLRVYPEGLLTSHVLGIVTIEGDGFYGVEGYHDSQLRGLDGKETVEQDPAGGKLPYAPLAYSPPKPGTTIVLTLDRNIQYIVEQELKWAISEYGAESGTVIVMDPQTGAILANVSYPTYDPNDYLDADLDSLADPSVSSMWEPGSIFKIITWAAGLDSGTIYPTTTFYDNGAMEVGGRVIKNWDRQGHGLVTMQDGLVESLNTVAAYISTSMGKERFYNYLQRFGVGRLTGVDLSSEGPGMVKQPGDSDWFPSELGTNSFGQGVAVTPMQMITAVAAVANRGLLVEPYIVHQFISTDPVSGRERVVQVEPMIMRRAISQATAETLTQMLVAVVEQGATEAQVPGYRIAGKTGTAQIPTAYGYHPTDTIASFVGFAPADDPQFIVLVKLDKPQTSPWGSRTAAPTFRAIAERLFVYMQIPPDEIRLAEMERE